MRAARPSDPLQDGDPYRDAAAREPGILKRSPVGNGPVFAVTSAIDPDVVRQEGAKADVAVGERSKKPVALETALQAWAAKPINGTVIVTFDVDAEGWAWRRTKVTIIKIGADSSGETRTATEVVERQTLRPDVAKKPLI